MKKKLILATLLFTIFLDFFVLGLIYPLFTSLVFEGNGDLVSLSSSDFYKNTVFGFLTAAFPFGQFLGAPIIGHLSDRYGRRKLLVWSLIGTILTLSICALGAYATHLPLLLLGRFLGGLMAGNLTVAYASFADFSGQEDKVNNFALIPLAMGMGFACGPYIAGILANPNTHSLAGPMMPFLAATGLALINLLLVSWRFPETLSVRKNQGDVIKSFTSSLTNLWSALQRGSLRPYLWILFLMLSANLVFVQFVGPLAIARFRFDITEVGYLYANIGISVSLGHLFLTRGLAGRCSSEQALMWSLISMGVLLMVLLLSYQTLALHIVAFFIMLACAVAYTNSMTLVSNQASKEQQGEVMGVAVSVQSCAEFLPAALLGLVAFVSEMVPIFAAALFAGGACIILRALVKKATYYASTNP